MKSYCGRSAALAAFILSSATGAQPPLAQTEPSTGNTCELHAWPGSGLNSVYHGWFHGGIANGAVTGREGYPEVPQDPIETPAQVLLLAEAQPQLLLHRPDYRLVVHPDALPSRTIRTSTGRLGRSDAPCYAELIVDDVFLQQDVINGSYLKILFRFRDFGGDALPRRTFGTWVKTPLKLFPPLEAQGSAAALAELKEAYRNDVAIFAQAVLKPLPQRK